MSKKQVRKSTFVYDAKTVCGVFDFPCDCKEEVPTEKNTVRYGGWILGELMATGKVKSCLLPEEQDKWKTAAGYFYTWIPGIKGGTRDKQLKYLLHHDIALQELPIAVGATVLAVHLDITGEDLLEGGLCRCAETLQDGGGFYHPGLTVRNGIVHVIIIADDNFGSRVSLGAARKSASDICA